MRIAYLSADYGIPVLGGKGASIHVQALIDAFDQLGHEVHLLCACLGSEQNPIRARVVEIQPRWQSGQNKQVDSAACSRSWKEQHGLEIARELERVAIERHSSAPFGMIYERCSLWSKAGVRAARSISVPCIIEVNAPLLVEQSTYRELIASEVASHIEAEVFVSADGIVAVSDAVREYCVSRGAHRRRVHVMPNGVDIDRFRPDIPPALLEGLDDDPVIGFTGSLKLWHGLPDLMEAFRIVLRQHAEARLLIVGDGPMRSWIEGFAEGAGLKRKVLVTGWTAHCHLPALIRRMDVAVAPYPAIEGFYFSPLKLFEYLAAGRAIVASSIGQVSEIIEDGVNGLLAEAGNPQQLADCLCRTLADPNLRTRLGRAARAAAEGRSWLGNARRVLELVGQAQRSRAPPATTEMRVAP